MKSDIKVYATEEMCINQEISKEKLAKIKSSYQKK